MSGLIIARVGRARLFVAFLPHTPRCAAFATVPGRHRQAGSEDSSPEDFFSHNGKHHQIPKLHIPARPVQKADGGDGCDASNDDVLSTPRHSKARPQAVKTKSLTEGIVIVHDLFKLGGSALTIRPQPDEQSL
jgi:hypothetical protein